MSEKQKEYVQDMGRALFPVRPFLLNDEKEIQRLAKAVSLVSSCGKIDRKEIADEWRQYFSFLIED